ncbi:MAG: PAS domain S-box protein [Chloroflexi bacterium]|nr:PAS domain S-box protein [Chloroflexota bacterium]
MLTTTSPLFRYGVAAGLVSLAFILKLLLDPLIASESPFLLLSAAIFGSAWYGGLRAGLLATVLSALISDYYFLAPNDDVVGSDLGSILHLLLFVLEALLLCVLSERLRTTRARAEIGRLEAEHFRRISAERDQWLRLLVEGVHDYAIYMLDPGGRVVSWNGGGERIFGYRADEVIGTHFSRFFPGGFASAEGPLQQALRAGRFSDEGWRVRKDGSRFWANGTITPLRDEHGAVRGFAKVTHDVTDRMQVEEALLVSEARFRALFEQSPLVIQVFDTSGKTIAVNPAFEKAFGTSEGSAQTYNILEKAKQNYGALQTHIDQLLAGGIIHTLPIPLETNGGPHSVNLPWIEITGYPVKNDTGEVQEIVLLARDVTDRMRTQEALRESEARFRNMADHAPVMVWVTELDGSCSYLSETWYDFTGQTPEASLGFGWLEAVHPDDRLHTELVFRNALEKRLAFRLEYRLRDRNGAYHWAIDSARPRLDVNGGFLGYIGSVMDITERKQAEDALQASELKYRTLFNSMDQGFCICELLVDAAGEPVDYRFVEVNRMFEPHTGLVNATGRTALELVPNLEHHWIETYGRVALTGEPFHFVQGSEAMERWFDVHAFRIGKPEDRRFAILFTDITSRRQAEEILNQQRQILQQIIDALPVMICLYESSDKFLYFNPVCEQLLGYGASETAEIDLLEKLLPDPETRQMVRSLMDAPDREWHDFQFTARDGSPVDSSWAVILLPDGRHVGIGIDQRARKRAEQRALFLQRLAAALSTAVTLEDVARIFLQRGVEDLGATAVSIALLSDDQNMLRIVGSVGYPESLIEKWREFPTDHPAAPLAYAYRNQTAVFMGSPDERATLLPESVALRTDEGHKAWAVLPFEGGQTLGGAIALTFSNLKTFDADERAFLHTLTDYCAQALDRARLTEQSRMMAAFDERQRLARELHDAVSQVLFASTMISDALPSIWKRDPDRAMTHLKDLVTLNRGALAEMRKLLLELRPESIVRTPFAELLDHLAKGAQAQKSFAVETDVQVPPEGLLPAEAQLNLYRIAQEAFNNIVKHSNATAISVTCTYREDIFFLRISDNGSGFDGQHVAKGLGMNGMRERASAIGAELDVASEPGKGTQIEVRWQVSQEGAGQVSFPSHQ